jgi:hypothetical protein
MVEVWFIHAKEITETDGKWELAQVGFICDKRIKHFMQIWFE